MAGEKNDSRLHGQKRYLKGVAFVWARFRALRDQEHEHCDFCWVKSMDTEYSDSHRRFIEAHPDVLVEGYATTPTSQRDAESHWICSTCFGDFEDLFGFRVEMPN